VVRSLRRRSHCEGLPSYSFRDEDRDLVAPVDALLSAQDVSVLRGTRLGGRPLTPEVMRRIDSTDALIALMTRRDELEAPGSGRWITHPWVRDELNHARDGSKHTIAVVEEGVELDGAYGENERISLDRENPLDALLALSETIALRRDEIGVRRRIHIRPDEIGQILRTTPGIVCRYRFVSPEGERTEWKEAEPVPQPSGAILYVSGVRGDDHFIEVEIARGDSMEWWSPATAQLITVDLKPRAELGLS
jgi:hypothetical protein